MTWTEMLLAVVQVAAGGTIVQAVVAFVRRRSELRKLDRESDSVAVETADRMIVMLRTELEQVRAELDLSRAERDALRKQVTVLGDDLAKLRVELVVARAEISRLQGGTAGG